MEQEASNAEDCFVVAIVKAETIIGYVPCKFLLHFPTPLSNLQLSLLRCNFASNAPYFGACLTASNEHELTSNLLLITMCTGSTYTY